MKIRRPLLTTVLSVLLLVAMIPMSASTYGLTPAGDTFKTSIKFEQAFLAEGGARLEPGSYEVVIRSLGDGSVRATFTGNGKTGYATGKAQVGKANGGYGNNKATVGENNQPNTVQTFANYGFTAQSKVSFQKQGNNFIVIVGGRGSNRILIGLLLPAVAPAQKVREAAAAPR